MAKQIRQSYRMIINQDANAFAAEMQSCMQYGYKLRGTVHHLDRGDYIEHIADLVLETEQEEG